MKRVLTAVVLIPVVLLLVFRAPLWLFALAVAGIVVLGIHEYLNISEAAGLKPFHRLTFAVALLLVYLFWRIFVSTSPTSYSQLNAVWMPFLLFPLVFGIPLVLRKDLKSGLAAASGSAFGTVYVAGSLALLIALRANPFHRTLLVFVLFSVWAGDIAAYYVGRSIGRHKLAPVVSPNKSWEGAIASVIASIAIAFLVLHFRNQIDSVFSGRHLLRAYWLFPMRPQMSFLPPTWMGTLILGVLTNVAAQFGDLFESALKRGAGVKDSGTLLPGHGGILDRIDALLFAIPAVWYYAQLTGFLLPAFQK